MSRHREHSNIDYKDEWIVEACRCKIHISANGTNIVWSKDVRFWKWIVLPHHDLPEEFIHDVVPFDAAAELNQVCWLEVNGTLNFENFDRHYWSRKTCEVIYHIKFKVDAFGWNHVPVTFSVGTTDGQGNKKTQTLNTHNKGWQEIHGGEFHFPATMDGKLKFGMSEIESGGWKGGMVFAGVTVRPKHA